MIEVGMRVRTLVPPKGFEHGIEKRGRHSLGTWSNIDRPWTIFMFRISPGYGVVAKTSGDCCWVELDSRPEIKFFFSNKDLESCVVKRNYMSMALDDLCEVLEDFAESLWETIDILMDPEAMAAIEEAEMELVEEKCRQVDFGWGWECVVHGPSCFNDPL